MKIRLLATIIFLTGISFSGASQDTTDYYLLKVEHKEKDRLYYIDKGEKLILRVATDSKKHKGKLDSVSADSIYLNNERFGINQVRMIMSRQMRSSLHFMSFMQIIAGSVLTTGGLILVSNPDKLSTGAGISGTILGIPILVKGIFSYFRNNHLWVKKGWKLSTIKLSDAVEEADQDEER